MHELTGFFVGDKTDGGFCTEFTLFPQGHRVYPAFGEIAVDHRLLFGINGDGMEVSSPLKVVQNSS